MVLILKIHIEYGKEFKFKTAQNSKNLRLNGHTSFEYGKEFSNLREIKNKLKKSWHNRLVLIPLLIA